MSKLHIISHSLDFQDFQSNLTRMAAPTDQFLFIADAVCGLLENNIIQLITEQKLSVFALQADCLCRGIEKLLASVVVQVSDEQMVELTVEHPRTISW